MTSWAPVPGVPLAELTTLELGGPAEYLVRAADRTTLEDALRWAGAKGLPVQVIGGGSNLVVGDEGLSGLVLRVETRGIRARRDGDVVELEVEAGEPWDAFVAGAVEDDLAGLECLSGIPGFTGATPIQNVGAYGQEVAHVIRRLTLLDRRTLEVVTRARGECQFGYRTSDFKAAPDRYVVLSVTFALAEHGPSAVRYGELARLLESSGNTAPGLREVRQAVLSLRRAKSMVIDPGDENRRSAGSFFLNPVLSEAQADTVARRAQRAGIIADPVDLPRFPHGSPIHSVKIPAAWLIERAGFTKGMRSGGVGISSQHALALVHHGGARSSELLAFARAIRDRVDEVFGVRLEPEPVLLGVRW